MSRTKKSRKQGSMPTAKAKLSKQELEKVEKRVRKKSGKQAGNRQKEANQPIDTSQVSGTKKDPRIGSKTPIVLGNVALGKLPTDNEKNKNKSKVSSSKSQPIAAIRFIDNESSTEDNAETKEQELASIEQDQSLQEILAKQESDIALTEQEVDYYNKMMERHQELRSELGLDDDAESAEETANYNSEDDLWNKLDNQDLSDY